jgi:MerR family transcriptional regulator/heat shock protein HspR
MISVAADLVGMHPQTLRIYEAKGLVQPQRTAGNTRLYSEADLDRLRLINQLTTELGLNLAGVEHVIRLEEQLRRMQRRMERLELDMRERLEEMRRSYSADLVPYDPDATRLPIRRTWTSTG